MYGDMDGGKHRTLGLYSTLSLFWMAFQPPDGAGPPAFSILTTLRHLASSLPFLSRPRACLCAAHV
jgi:hypothetical protein